MIPFLLILTAALALAVLARRSFAQTMPLAVLGAALLTYLCTGLRHKSWALPLAALAALGLLALWALQARKGGAAALNKLFTPALAALGLALVAAWVCVAPLRMAILDDLVHWALNTKQLCYLQGFPAAAQIASAYADYPPGGQMLAVFLHLGRPFSQTLLYWANLLLLFALELPLLGRLRWTKKPLTDLLQVLGGAAVLLAFPAFYNRYYTISLVVEPLMALLLGYALYTAWRCMERPDALGAAGVSAALCLLALTKNTGLAYACFGLLAVAALWWPALHKNGWRAKAGGAALAALPFAAWYSWERLCEANGTASYFTQDAPTAYTWTHVKEFLRGEGVAGQVIPDFVKNLFTQPLNKHIGLSAMGLLLLVWLAALLLLRARPAPPRRFYAALGLLTGCFAAYAASVCYSYVYLFDEWEAETLNSFSRYMAPLPAAMVFLALGPVCAALAQCGRSRLRRGALASGALALAVCSGPLLYWTPGGYEAAARGIDRGYYQQAEQQCAALLAAIEAPQGARVVVVSDGFATDRPNQLRKYFLLPATTLNWSEAQYGSREKAGAVWQNALVDEGYGYVWCAPESGPVLQAYEMRDASGQPLQAGALYAVTRDGRFELERLAD